VVFFAGHGIEIRGINYMIPVDARLASDRDAEDEAITLDRLQVAIHGTTKKMRRSIGTAASYGCIRMLNEDVIDLFDRVRVGTPVLMIP
jgi:hypothetical protein